MSPEPQDTATEARSSATDRIPEGHVVEMGGTAGWRDTLIALVVLAIALQVGSALTPAYILPGWDQIWEGLLRIRVDHVIATVARVFVAMFFSFVLGALLGIGAYSLTSVDRYIVPLVRVLMAVPAVSWIIITILWFRTVEVRIFFVLAMTCAPIFMLDVLDGLRSVERDLRDMLRSFRPTRWQFYRKLMFPSVLPIIFTSWKVNSSLAIRIVTFAELVGAASGLGFALNQAKNLFRIADVFALTVILVAWLIAMQGAILWLEKRSLRWRD